MKFNPQASTSTNKLISLAIFSGIFLIYIAFPTKNYYYDGIFFARVIENSTGFNAQLIHPNHLLYNLFGYLAYRLTRALGLTVRAIEVLQVLNSLASVLSAYVLFRIMKENFSRYVAWALTFLFAFSVTWWKFSTDADAYILSTLFLLICFYLVLPHSSSRPLPLIVTFSLAVFFHQLAILFYPVIILGLLWQSHEKRILRAVGFAVGAFVVIFGTYCFLFFIVSGTFSGGRLVRWITSYSPDASFSFNVMSNLGYTVRGHARLFFGGRLSLIKGLISPLVSALIVIWITLIALLLWKLISKRSIRNAAAFATMKNAIRLDPFAKLCLVWISIYVVFLFFWLPHNTFYRLFYLPAIVLLVGWAISRRTQPNRKYRLALFVGVMAMSNFLVSIFPFAHVEKNPPLALALEMNRVWPTGTVVYYAAENADNNLFQYFNPTTVWKPLCCISQVESDPSASRSAGESVWLETTAIDQMANESGGTDWLAKHGRQSSRRELIDRAYRIRFIEVIP